MSSPTDRAIVRLCDSHYHNCLYLPESDAHPRLRVTYSTTRNFADRDLPVLLMVGPMFGNRWHAVGMDHLAQQSGIRVICTDRPGMGGSTPVDVSIRVRIWIETVPALLQKLDVKHVALITHSAGAVYLLNTLYQLRDILVPEAPYAAILAPWVATASSNATLTSLCSAIPSGVVERLSSLNRFIVTAIAPSAAWSGDVFSGLADLLNPASEKPNIDESVEAERYGVDDEAAKLIDKLLVEYSFAEDISAGSQEALLCLRKGGPGSWGVCDDYAEFVRSFARREEERRQASPSLPKLKLRAYFASSDLLIGEGGRKYFEECWAQDGVADAFDFESTLVPSTNHDSIVIDRKIGVLKEVFGQVKQLSECS